MSVDFQFRPRSYQARFLKALQAGVKRAVCVWHRRAGKDLTAWNWTITAAMARAGTYFFFYPTYAQGKKILWDGKDKEGRPFLSYIPEGAIVSKNETEMQVKVQVVTKDGVSTGGESIIQIIGTDNMDSIVGTNPLGCVFSEFSLQDPTGWDLVRPILRENGGWAIFLYTPRGRNHGWNLYEMTRRPQNRGTWYSELLTVRDTRRDGEGENGAPVITDADIEAEIREGMDPDLVQQEYFCSFTGSLQGSYFGRQLEQARAEERIGAIPWEPAYYVNTAWDLGVGDDNAIWFYQTIGLTIRLIDYHTVSGWSVPEYAKLLKEKPYAYNVHLAPHDIKQREWTSGKSRWDTARTLGIVFRVAPKMKVDEGISAVRKLFPRFYFDEVKCARGLDALASYHKEWDPVRRCYDDRPYHDWSSHGADALRTLATALVDAPTVRRETQARTAFDPMAYEHEFNPLEDSPDAGGFAGAAAPLRVPEVPPR